jgi:hypothetical protein
MSFLFNQQYGPGVEEFLKPQELFSLGLVSKGSRIRPQQTAFRQKIKKVIELPSILDMPMRYNSDDIYDYESVLDRPNNIDGYPIPRHRTLH